MMSGFSSAFKGNAEKMSEPLISVSLNYALQKGKKQVAYNGFYNELKMFF